MEFKKDLYEQLKQEVPFTEELAQKIVKGRPKKKRKPYVPIVVLAIVAIFSMWLITKPAPSPYLSASFPASPAELVAQMKANEVQLPFAQPKDGQRVVSVEQATINGFRGQFFSHFHYIVEPVQQLAIGDYIVFDAGGEQVAQVVATAGQHVDVKDHKVYVDNQALLLPGMVALDENKVHLEHIEAVFYYIEPGNMSLVPSLHTRDFTLAYDEIAVKQSGQIEVHKLEKVKGKVVAFQDVEPTLALTDAEQQLYAALKEQGIEVLRDVSPISILKLYIHTWLQLDSELNYEMTSYNENYFNMTKEEHLEMFARSEAMLGELHKKLIAQLYNGIEHGVVSEPVSGELLVTVEADAGHTLLVKMRPNEDGILQVGDIEMQ